jgi:hypothetical protein
MKMKIVLQRGINPTQVGGQNGPTLTKKALSFHQYHLRTSPENAPAAAGDTILNTFGEIFHWTAQFL